MTKETHWHMNLGYDLKSMMAYGAAAAMVLLSVKACEEMGEQQRKIDAIEAKAQTPANMRDAAEKSFKAKGFSNARYVSMEKGNRSTQMGYTVTRDGITYDASVNCSSRGCSEPNLIPVRSEQAEKAATALWKQNGYEIVTFTVYRQNLGDATQDAILSQNGAHYKSTVACETPQNCRIKSIRLLR